jgi:hypothetical protein
MNNTNREIKSIKSALVLGVIASLPGLIFNEKDSDLLVLALMIISLCAFHERGKHRRAGSNFFSQVRQNNFPQSDAQFEALQNAFFNIINGGGAVFDDTVSTLNNFMRH